MLVEELEFGPLIGSGSFGNVYKGTWKGVTVALKCVRLPPGSDMSLLPTPKEVEVLRLVGLVTVKVSNCQYRYL